ncbi:MAG: S9 family peptidase [Pseudomonadota bacterium]
MTLLKPPAARRDENFQIDQLGRIRTDPYHWLKDENWQAVMRDPSVLRQDVRDYLEAENEYTKENVEAPLESLQKTLLDEMRGRIKEDDSSVPSIDGPYAYYSRYREGGEYPVFARRDRSDTFNEEAPETILFDGDLEAGNSSYFDIGGLGHSPDHKWLAFAIDRQGSEFYTLKVRNIESGEELPFEVDKTTGGFVWSEASDAIFWVERNENGRSCAVHKRGLYEETDTLIYKEEDEGFFVGAGKSQSGDIIFITANDHTTSEWRWLDARSSDTEPKLIAARERGHEYSVAHHDDAFYILTNYDDAVDFKITRSPIGSTDPSKWEDVIPHAAGTLILDVISLEEHLVRLERSQGLPRIVIRERRNGSEHTIHFDEAAYALGISGGYEFKTRTLRFSYSSPTTPGQVFDYDIDSRDRSLRKTQKIPSGHEIDSYICERIISNASDGAEVPITLLRHRDTPVDGSAPLLLYGYGSYGITIPAGFSTSRLSLVDRGFIFAIAHIRGSTVKGYQWYLDGKLEKKTNTFTDFISAAGTLIEANYTSAGSIVAMGGSAGGLLMGAISNMAPELFGGVIAAVPFVDVLNTMSDESLPLTPPEWPEWGNPLNDQKAYDTIEAYSPYDQVSDRPYPRMLITGGLSDPRVTYWEPAKWAAKLRHEAPDAGPYFLRINMEAGHGGSTGRFEGLKETALEYAFALQCVGLANNAGRGSA